MDSMKDVAYALKYGAVLTIGSWKLYDSAGYWYVQSDAGVPHPLQTTSFEEALLYLLEKAATITEPADK